MIIGLTGGIGSGKSTIANVFKFLSIPVYEADSASKRLIDEDSLLQAELVMLLGADIIKEQRINRPLMAQRIFGDKEILAQTNALIHPAVARDFVKWHQEHLRAAYVIREAAILFESGTFKDCSKVIVVTAPKEMRINRVMERNSITRDEVLQRMSNQWSDEEKLSRADYVIYNDHNQSVIKQVLTIHEDIINSANPGGG